ncbi:Crp/Fnr family transcriptional regulator [Paraflavitalea pollutisoli]|uniref:Crp/Fnr family transcriptional regulator n=1 Tax=Paraflavitalea pollutisoli TaxID=3034143 RepID=UPI0023EAEAB7|nr:Crp/Fnr family transcriptional regulator [Paraflavitalea sp. H1-2-19X]
MKAFAKQLLLQHQVFNAAAIDALLDHTTVETFDKGAVVIQEGRVCHKCYFVLKGCLRQYRNVEGIEKTCGFYQETDQVVMYSSYFSGLSADTSIQCMEDCILLSGTKAQEAAMYEAHPATDNLVFRLLSDDYRKAEEYINLLNAYNPEQRYQALLQSKPAILNRVPLVHIASYIGVTPESLSRIRKRIVDNAGKV